MLRDQLRVMQGDKGLVAEGSVGIRGSILLRDQDGRENETTCCLFEPFKYNNAALLISHSSPTLFSINHATLRSSPSSHMRHWNIPPSIIRMWA